MNDWLYRLGHGLLDLSVRLYYRHIEVAGRELIPASGPAILVANHPNSVADAFLVASQLTERKINFIAKDTLTRAPVLGPLLLRFGVVGVARTQDHSARREVARERNQHAINSCVPRLLEGELIAIFGEGTSTDMRRLQMIRKGAMRFGYAAERAVGFNLGLAWVPVGITYSAKHHFRSEVLMRVAPPFFLRDLHPDPAAHEAEVLQRGTERLQAALESILLNIENETLGGLIDRLALLLVHPSAPLSARLESQQRVARAVQYFNIADPARLNDLEQTLRRYETKLASAGLTDEVVRQRHPMVALYQNLLGALRDGSLMTLGLYGWANSVVPRWMAFLFRPLSRSVGEWIDPSKDHPTGYTRQALWGTMGGWLGAALAFPVQTFLVFHYLEGRWGREIAMQVAAGYAVSLIPAWQFFVRRRDRLRQRLANVRHALTFLRNWGPAVRLQAQRRRLRRRLHEFLNAFDAAGPRLA